MILYFGLG